MNSYDKLIEEYKEIIRGLDRLLIFEIATIISAIIMFVYLIFNS